MLAFFFIMLILGFIVMVSAETDRIKDKKETYSEQGLKHLMEYKMECLGGFSDMGACKKCTIDVFEDRIKIYLIKQSTSGARLGDKLVEIMLNDIIDASIQTETQITQQVSLGKLVVFGLLSFAMKKKEKQLVKEYVVLTMNYNKENVSLVLKSSLEGSMGEKQQFRFFQQINSLRKRTVQCIN